VVHGTDRQHVQSPNGADVREPERQERLRPARGDHEFDLERVRRINLDDSAHISGLETMPGKVANEQTGSSGLKVTLSSGSAS
jgi:hypothetical protein